ncbi:MULTISPECIES: DUF1161 domain-containing protein [Tenebrionibacter/Tenebrionicola group]|jgi:hypothetical protein|uniref:DUF1161 domain-containing protein n=2 Tax=Tenebrionibacter/Tenebrionicola group TaxID=2969848 RepID=A0A8K0Y047_9ENTR|nr:MULTISPECIES: DUF1161 domain-containing protein [Tenebrionibacter/Tenebrionicola group]MBK4716269.1 DUF1161 domain-containing protein [Tenebrionibacter intestinalis]MBV4411257.1 DUF1161 domain-containing protein [Tenebrionicola larvae]MBV5096924.1 DUF1161 domain-containing protein [Tenebrionicola larvae]
MIRSVWPGVLLLATAVPALSAQNSCEKVKTDIEQRIINNGVPQANFTLRIVPGDRANQPDAQVVGHCANDTQKILYTRTASGNHAVNGGAARDAGNPEPQQ